MLVGEEKTEVVLMDACNNITRSKLPRVLLEIQARMTENAEVAMRNVSMAVLIPTKPDPAPL